MAITLDQKQVDTQSSPMATLADALNWAQDHMSGSGRIIVKVVVDGQELSGQEISQGASFSIQDRSVQFETANQKDLSLKLLGKMHALIQFLAAQHQSIAGNLEKGQQAIAMKQLGEVLTAWQQVHMAYSGLINMLKIDLSLLAVGERSGESLVQDFSNQLREISNALKNKDMVLLGDILQYEMDGAIQNWNLLLAATLAVVDPDAGNA